MGDRDETIRLWDVPQAVGGDVEQVSPWATVLTGMELDEANAVRPLNGNTWINNQNKLQQLQMSVGVSP